MFPFVAGEDASLHSADSLSPSSDNVANELQGRLSLEEQEQQRAEWSAQLAKVSLREPGKSRRQGITMFGSRSRKRYRLWDTSSPTKSRFRRIWRGNWVSAFGKSSPMMSIRDSRTSRRPKCTCVTSYWLLRISLICILYLYVYTLYTHLRALSYFLCKEKWMENQDYENAKYLQNIFIFVARNILCTIFENCTKHVFRFFFSFLIFIFIFITFAFLVSWFLFLRTR